MKKRWNRIAAVALAGLMTLGTLSGCQPGKEQEGYASFITVTVFDTLANYEGIQSGWFAKIVKDKFNMELNIMAPNVSSTGDSLYQDRFAAGNIGDLIICGNSSAQLQDLVDAGLIINMSPYINEKDIYTDYEKAIHNLNDTIRSPEANAIWAVPTSVSAAGALTPSEGETPNYGMYMRYDLYDQLGAPEIGTLEDALPILKQMQELCPTSDTGKPTYAFSFFGDWDGNMTTFAKQPACFYGYDEFDFVLLRADGKDFQNILDRDSLYYRSLKFFFEANQMGLVDPESESQNYADVFRKMSEGQILSAPWPWLGQSAYNTAEHLNEDKAVMFVPIEDEKIMCYGSKENGATDVVVCVGSQAADQKRLIDFIDWLYSPAGIAAACAQRNQATAGPEGMTWEMTENGPVLNEFGKLALMENGDVTIPEEWGTGTWADGVCQLNFTPISKTATDPQGYAYYYMLWPSVINTQKTKIETAWSDRYQAMSVMELVQKNGQTLVAPATSIVKEKETTELDTIRKQCDKIIVSYSWKMAFAENEETFNQLYEEMVSRAYAAGYETVYEFDLKCAKVEAAERERVAAEASK